MTTRIRPNTPDRVNADGSTTFHIKRCCNGCGQKLGDLAAWDHDGHGNLTDVRGECAHCLPLVEAEAAGARTWKLTQRSIARIDNDLDRLDVFAKGYWQYVDGKNTLVGLRVGAGEDRVVAYFDDWIIRHRDGRFTVHAAPKAVEA
ncbi:MULTISPECIES: hypothetical protein [unclassified Streptomyces]|uniref:hypothetical protein n=1 Tax=unclassified Streptomyces TaxID=2593676 RepID=UPI00278C623A|nr:MULTISPECIES: hypothetical protein [unclassified Streptomyces]